MTEPLPDSELNGETRSGPPGMPRWVKVSVVILVILAVVLFVVMALSGGEHGPGIHTGVGESAVALRAVGIASR